jgi:hypothetical protein
MTIGDVVIYRGREVVLLGLEPMSVPNRQARVCDPVTGDEFDVPLDELQEDGGLPSTG